MRKKGTLLLIVLFMFSLVFPLTHTSAKAKAKVYPVHMNDSGTGEFSKKLKNGLSVGIEERDEWNYTPFIKKGKKKVWSLKYLSSTFGYMQYTETKEKDTFLYYTEIAGGGARTSVVGVHSNGKVFLKKGYTSGAGLDTKFLSANTIEVAIERMKKNWDPGKEPNAEKYTDTWDVKRYSLSKTGKMKLVKKYVQKKRKTNY
ncbi:hypothetical protein ACQKIC_02765 [Peribacillus sp. NPDC046944]|uniref:hypothetical protein n=1 Tax=unclassified Peribacillus TaxID=2675266 RepID=UPI003D0667E3